MSDVAVSAPADQKVSMPRVTRDKDAIEGLRKALSEADLQALQLLRDLAREAREMPLATPRSVERSNRYVQ